MKIITWNCNMAFRKKAEFILGLEPDILIIPECENPALFTFGPYTKSLTGQYWDGDLPNKGLGIFTFNDFKIKLLDIYNPAFRYIFPISVYNDKITFTIFAVWAQKPARHDGYIEQVWNAVQFYSELLEGENIILAGDFNSNTIFDKPKRAFNHTSLVGFLKTKHISSAYHQFHSQLQGKETHPTLFLHRKKDRGFHIDYCFLSENLIGKIKNVEVGDYETWTKYSDHKPLIVTLDM